MPIKPLSVSKVNTGLQIGLVALVLGLDAARLSWPPVREAAIWLVAASTIYSFGAYVRRVIVAA
jgi:hypothetical protein